ncbi:MAG: hypothetical protein HQL30_12600 [Candidatus Omnitrophica bacterium]|nr:hypothetical protein [Candidatus Omnitrophota bacterium]
MFNGVLSGTALSSVVSSATTTVVGIGTSYLVSSALNALGVDPLVSGIISSVITGGVTGLVTGGAGAVFSEALKWGAYSSMSMLGTYFDLDPVITGIMSMATSAMVGGFTSGMGLGETLGKIAPNIAGELAYYGVQQVGEAVGMDPTVSSLAGIGIRSSLQMGFSSGGGDPGAWLDGAISGLTRGITSVGLQLAYQALNINPLIGSLGAAAISGALESFLEGRNPLEGVFDTYFKAGSGLLSLGGPGATPWEEAAYIAQILDFTEIIRDQGIVAALEIYATGYLHQTTIDNIWKLGGIYDLLLNSDQIEITVNGKGEDVKRVFLDEEKQNYVDLSLNDDRIMGLRQGNVTEHCVYGKGPDGKPVLKDGEREILMPDGSVQIVSIKDYKIISIRHYDADEKLAGYYVPAEEGGHLIINADDTLNTGKYVNIEKGYEVVVKDNELLEARLDFASRLSQEDLSDASTYNLTEDQIEHTFIVYNKENGYVPELYYENENGTIFAVEPYESITDKIQNYADNVESFYRDKFGFVEWDNARSYLSDLDSKGNLTYEIPSYIKPPEYGGDSISIDYNSDQLYLGNIFMTPDGYYSERTFNVIKIDDVFVTVTNGFLNELGGYVNSALPAEDIVDRLGNRYSDVSRLKMISAVRKLFNAVRGGIDAYNTKFGFYQVHFQRKGDFTVGPYDQWRYYVTGTSLVGFDFNSSEFQYGEIAFDESITDYLFDVNQE